MAKRNNLQLELGFQAPSNSVQDEDEMQSNQRIWLKASYHFHSYCYRDPRTVSNSGVGLPVVSPTTVILGITSTLFRMGLSEEAQKVVENAHQIPVLVDAPDGVIFFRAFHQLRRFETAQNKGKGVSDRVGFTKINQGTKEYGLIDGTITVYLQPTLGLSRMIKFGMENLTHLGTHDSLTSLIGMVEEENDSPNILYKPGKSFTQNEIQEWMEKGLPITMVTLSSFVRQPTSQLNTWKWFMAGGNETEVQTFIIPGKFIGTSNGKIYLKS